MRELLADDLIRGGADGGERDRDRRERGKEWAIVISCGAGVHRSVAFARRLSEEVEAWGRGGIRVRLTCFGLGGAVERRRWRRWRVEEMRGSWERRRMCVGGRVCEELRRFFGGLGRVFMG